MTNILKIYLDKNIILLTNIFLEEKSMYCPNCGQPIEDRATVCQFCGATVMQQTAGQKSKLAAGLLGIFLGYLGIHNFYLGFTKKAVIQLVLSLVGSLAFGIGPAIMAIWGLVEGIMYLTGTWNVDANGNPLI